MKYNINDLTESVLTKMDTILAESGFAGPTDIPKLVYLSLVTGMLSRPVSMVIKGASGAGKSFALSAALQFVPANAYERYEGMSEKAIVYLKGIDLKHKHLIIGEAAGMAEGAGRALLRQLLSEGKVRYATVESTDKGISIKELPTLEGPTGLIMTTTATTLHPEDESRMLSVHIRESKEAIREALMAQATGGTSKRQPIDTAPWHAHWDLMRQMPKEVKIPFAKEIAAKLPSTHDRIKRDFTQVLSLIRACALVHGMDREKDGDGEIIANREDYEIVFGLVNRPLSEGLAQSVPDHIRRLVEAVETLMKSKRNPFEGVSPFEAARALDRDRSSVSRAINAAVKDGYLRDENPGQGRESKIVIGEVPLPTMDALPRPVDLFSDDHAPIAVTGLPRHAEAKHVPW